MKQQGVTLPARPTGAPGTGTTGTGTTGTGTDRDRHDRDRHDRDRHDRDRHDRDRHDRDRHDRDRHHSRRGLFGGGGGFAANPKLRAAFQACGARFGFGGGQGFRARLSHTTITKYVTCVRQHGYNLPNPNFSGKGPMFPANIRNNAKFQAASRACQSLLAPPRPSGSGTGTSTNAGA